MKRRLLLMAVCALAALGPHGQSIAVSGNLKNLGIQNATGSNTFVRFNLANHGGVLPVVTGSNAIVSDYQDFHPDANGNIGRVITGNDSITPAGTSYLVCVFSNGIQFRCNTYSITAALYPAGFNLNTAQPTIPTTTRPNQIAGARSFVFTPSTPSTIWTIVHNFNDSHPDVFCTDANGIVIYPDQVQVMGPNTVVVRFVSGQSGSCNVISAGYLNIASSDPNALVTNPAGNQTVSAPFSLSFTGRFSTAQASTGVLNGAAVVGSSSSGSWKYPCTTAGVQAAINGALNLTNGVTQHLVDARACVNMTITSEIEIGNVGGQALTFLGPAGGTWTVSGITDGVSCAIKQFNNTRIIGEGFQNPWTIHAGLNSGGASLGAVYCTQSGGNAYFYMENVNLSNPNTVPVANGAFYVNSAVDNSTWKNVVVASYGTTGAVISAVCCSASFINFTSTGNWTANSLPLRISGLSFGITFENASITHPGPGIPNILITGPNSIVTFAGTLYLESSDSDTTTPLIQITDAGSGSTFTAQTILSSPVVARSTAYVLKNVGTSEVSIQSLQRRGTSIGTNGVNEVGLGFTVPTNAATGSLTMYNNRGFFSGGKATLLGGMALGGAPTITSLQIFNTTTTCTTAASAGATCTTAAITLPLAQADTSYRVTCTGKGPTNVPTIVATANSSATQFTITIAALTAAAATYSSYDCTVGHN